MAEPNPAEAQTGTRKVRFGSDIHDTPVYWRDHLPLEVSLEGPAIIQQMDTTLLIEPGDTTKGDEHGNIILHVGAPA